MNLVDEINLTIALTKLVLGVNEDKALLFGNFLTTGKELASVVFHHGIVFCRYNTLSNDFFFRDIQVVTFVSFCRWSDNGFRETLVFFHTVRQTNTTNLTATILVFAPCRASEDRTDNHLYTEALTLQTYSDHRVGSGQFPVGADVTGGIKEFGSNLVEHLSFVGNSLRENNVKGRDAVCCYHNHQVIVDVVHVAYLTMIYALLSFKAEVSLC